MTKIQTVTATKAFLDIIDKTANLEVLTTDAVREFIDKIVVHHREKRDDTVYQTVEIYYNVIGKFEKPKFLYRKVFWIRFLPWCQK